MIGTSFSNLGHRPVCRRTGRELKIAAATAQWPLFQSLKRGPDGTDRELVPFFRRQYLRCIWYVNLDSISGQGWTLSPVLSRPRTTDLRPRGFGVLPFGQVHNTHRSTHVQGVLWYGVERVLNELAIGWVKDDLFFWRASIWRSMELFP